MDRLSKTKKVGKISSMLKFRMVLVTFSVAILKELKL